MNVIHISDFNINENAIPGFQVNDLYVRNENGQDWLDGYTFTLSDPRFSYDYLDRHLILNSEINFEALGSKSFTLQITAEKGSGQNKETLTSEITITVIDLEEAPTNLTMTGGTVGEDAVAGTAVATLHAIDEDTYEDPEDPDDQGNLSYEFVTDSTGETVTTHSLFEIFGNQIRLKSQPGDAKAGTYTFWVRAFDENTDYNTERDLWTVKQITLTITDTIKEPVVTVNTVNGGSKNDSLIGTAEIDSINGGAGNDKLYGYAGSDTLLGGAGKDTLYAGDGNDVLNGGLSKDKLYGGLGQDTFVFDTAVRKGQFDQIYDFKSSDDTIQISLAALKAFKVKGPKTSDVHSKKNSDDKGKPDDKGGSKKSVGFDKIFIKDQKLQKKFFNVGTKLNDTPDGSNDYIFYNKKNGFVYLDVDGSGKGKGIEILKVKPGTTLTADDFLFI